MNRIQYLVLLLICLPAVFGLATGDPGKVRADSNPDVLWWQRLGSGADSARDVAVDKAGSIYVVGFTDGALPGQTGSGGADAYVRKYDAGGNEVWTRQFGSTGVDHAEGVAIDLTGNIYVTGWTDGLPGQRAWGQVDAYLKKFDSSGAELWTRQFGSKRADYARRVAVDRSGNILVAGWTDGLLGGTVALGYVDAFIRKYDSSGTELWTRQFGSKGLDHAEGVAIDSSGNIYVTGWVEANLPDQKPSGGVDAFLRKYDEGGKELWTRQFGTTVDDFLYGVATDSTGNPYVAGHSYGVLPGQEKPYRPFDAFVRKYDVSGTEIWTRQFGTYEDDKFFCVTVDNKDNVVAAGCTYAPLPGQQSFLYVDAFARSYDGRGNELWTKEFGTSVNDEAYGVATDTNGNIYLSGGTKIGFTRQPATGKEGGFLAKLGVPFTPPPPQPVPPTGPPKPEELKFVVSNLMVSPTRAQPGQALIITADVANTGNKNGSYKAELMVDGAVADSKQVDVTAGATVRAIFTLQKLAPGTYKVTLAGEATSFTVSVPPDQNADEGISSGMLITLAAVGLAILAVGLLATRR